MHVLTCLCSAEGELGLEMTAYEIEEGGKLEVCVVVTTPTVECPFVFSVIIYLELSSITAGIHSSFHSLSTQTVLKLFVTTLPVQS